MSSQYSSGFSFTFFMCSITWLSIIKNKCSSYFAFHNIFGICCRACKKRPSLKKLWIGAHPGVGPCFISCQIVLLVDLLFFSWLYFLIKILKANGDMIMLFSRNSHKMFKMGRWTRHSRFKFKSIAALVDNSEQWILFTYFNLLNASSFILDVFLVNKECNL